MTVIEQGGIPQNRQLNYVFGELQMPGRSAGGQILYFGWGADGRPLATKERLMLTNSGLEMADNDVPRVFPFDAEVANYKVEVSEFEEMALPTDNPDRGRQYTEDLVSIACTDEVGAVRFLEVEELTLLKAIIDGQVEWHLRDSPSYSVVIPDASSEKLNILLFSPSGEETNELSYRTFLLKVIKTLATIDRNQNPPDQKGYMDVLRAVVKQLEERTSQKKTVNGVFQKIATDLGILNEVDSSGAQELAFLSVEQLRYVLQKSYEVVAKSFEDGK